MKASILIGIFFMVLLITALPVMGVSADPPAPVTLFQTVHQGQNQGNWNVGIWKYKGDGTGAVAVNSGGSGAVRWDDGSQGTDNGLTHDFTLTYDPATYALSFQVVGGSKTVVNTTTSPYDLPAAPGPVNNLHMIIKATAGTFVQCANQGSMPKQQVDSSKTTVSNLVLDGTPLTGIEVEAKLVDNPTSETFTNTAELDIPVPSGAAWTLTGKITVAFVAANMAAPPKQNRIGMTALNGQYVTPPLPPPPAEVGGIVYPTNARQLLIPFVIFTVALVAGTTLVFRRKRIHN